MKKYLLSFFLGAVFFTGVVFAAPSTIYQRSILPEADQTYDLGSTTPALQWKNVYTKNLFISGTCTGCASSAFEIATTTDIGISGLSYFTKTSGRTTLGSVATTTLTGTAPITFSQPISVIGSSASVITCAVASGSLAGCLSTADWTTFNSKLSSYDAWTHTTNYGVSVSATTSPIWFQNGLMASSTSYFDNVFTINATTTNLSLHAVYADATDGIQVKSSGGLNVANFGLANSQNSLFYGGVNIDGATRLATSLNGALSASSGAVSAGTLSIANGGTNATSFTTTGNGVYWNGTSLLTAPLTSAVTYPFASSTSLTTNSGTWLATAGGSVGVGTTSPLATLAVQTGGATDILYLARLGSRYLSLDFAGATANFETDAVPFWQTNSGKFLVTTNVTDATQKDARLGVPHYTNSEEPFLFGLMSSTVSANQAQIGGGSSLGNSATLISFYTAANNTTVTGTERMRIDSAGNVGIGTTSPAQLFSVGNALTNGGIYGSTVGFAIGSSTPAFPFSVTPVLSNLASTFYINSAGSVVAYDSTNAWTGRISPTRSFVLGTGTTTGWTASTTGSAYSPFLQMPFAGTLRQVRCGTDASFLGVNVVVAGSNATPSYFVASTTIGKVPFTAGNTFTAGQKILANFGTTTTSGSASISCTFDVTED